MVFSVNKQHSLDVKYIATIRRFINEKYSYMQLNAFTEQQNELAWNHPKWPALLILVYNPNCLVPMPCHLLQFHKSFIATLPTFWKCICRLAISSKVVFPAETKWEIETINI